MKVGFLSESPADEAAVRILVEAVLDRKVRVVQPPLRARGWPNVIQVLPAVLRYLQFQTDADALVVVVDSDDTVIHETDHADPNGFHPQCRLCQLELTIRRTRKRWRLPQHRAAVATAAGMAVPAIEGWYLCGRDEEVGEQTWHRCMERGQCPFTRRDLKWRVYGTSRPPLPKEIEHATREARRLAKDLSRLESDFPVGFGHLSRSVRAWSRKE